jgi:hypoxia-inducible factor 1 alpha
LDIPLDDKCEVDDEELKDEKMQVLSKIAEDEKCALMALDGFLLVLNDEGDITYVSDTISEYLGLSKVRPRYCSIKFQYYPLIFTF